MAVLSVKALAKSYGGVKALAAVSFDIAAGEIVALIGPNGAGKTTCFNVLNGQLAPDSGEALLDGVSLAGRAPHKVARLGVGRTFQVAATFGSMTARENVQVALRAAARRVNEADAILALVGMAGQPETACAALAYGELKRVELAMVLVQHPRLLLMDEPTAGMALEERDALMALAADLARSENIAVLFTEHDMDVVFGFADRVIALHLGEVIAQGAPELVRANARLREVYLGDA
ncbi:MAG: branched-chain amino acid transport system ATP-binding protein [Betaproteobacteria bacterium]|jgi:branched-chain amino acid transport system ATP-binding protein|nr:branched-chain amino acid transport system ATP-binding protein [Betaproteobacteria bacterium]